MSLSDNAYMIAAVRCVFAIVAITILCILAISEGLDGELLKWGLALIGTLGGSEVVLEYWFKKSQSAPNQSQNPPV